MRLSPKRKALRALARAYARMLPHFGPDWALELYALRTAIESITKCLNSDEGAPTLSDLKLLIPGGYRHSDPYTARDAALANLPLKGSQREELLHLHVSNHPSGGMSNSELQTLTPMLNDSLTTRVSELVSGGWLEDSGVTRINSNSIACVVWRLSQKARDHFNLP